MDSVLAWLGNTLAVFMCYALLRKGYWRCAFLFVFIQCIQLCEIPTLALLKVPVDSTGYQAYYDTWHVFDEVNVPLELIAAWSIGRKRCGLGWVTWIMVAHLVLKEIHYSQVDVTSDLTRNLIYYARVLVNIGFEIAVLTAVIIRPAVKPLKEQRCQKKRRIPSNLFYRIRTTKAVLTLQTHFRLHRRNQSHPQVSRQGRECREHSLLL